MDRIVVWAGFENVTDSFLTIGGVEGTILRWKSIKAGWARNDSLVANQFISQETFKKMRAIKLLMYFDLDTHITWRDTRPVV